MPNGSPKDSPTARSVNCSIPDEPWHTFDDILRRLHQQKIYLHPHQLAEFLLWHGLPVDLRYVPKHLKQRAEMVNANYQGDMARLEDLKSVSWYSSSLME